MAGVSPAAYLGQFSYQADLTSLKAVLEARKEVVRLFFINVLSSARSHGAPSGAAESFRLFRA